jgi:hypothetical protein
MTQGGYHHSSLWKSLETYVLKADAAALRKKLGLAGPSGGGRLAAAPAPAQRVSRSAAEGSQTP